MRRFFHFARTIVLLAVAGCFIASVTLLLYAGIAIVQETAAIIVNGTVSTKEGKMIALDFIQNADIFLISTVLYIMSVGLYELFIDDSIDLPAWLVIRNLDDLKEKLIGIVVVGLAVDFLGHALTWQGESSILYLGGAMALVIAGLTLFTVFRKKAVCDDNP
jgi:uncharacterized membrane protein YqhA